MYKSLVVEFEFSSKSIPDSGNSRKEISKFLFNIDTIF
jgi:hypothetical protein